MLRLLGLLLLALSLSTSDAYPGDFAGCTPRISEVIMGTKVLDDTYEGKLPLQLWDDVKNVVIGNETLINPYQNYTIQVLPNYGAAHLIHMIVMATSGHIDIAHSGPVGQSPIDEKKECAHNGYTGVVWHGITDPLGAEEINFRWTPATFGNATAVKFSATAATDYLAPVYQHALYTGGYHDLADDTTQGDIALAVVVVLMLLIPISGIVLYCGIHFAMPFFRRGGRAQDMTNDDDDDYGKSGTEMATKSKRKDKFQKIDEAGPDRD